MKASVMYNNPVGAIYEQVKLLAVLSVFLFSPPVPNEVYDTISAYLDVPVGILKIVTSLLGSLGATMIQSLLEYRRSLANPGKPMVHDPAWVLLCQVLVGWMVGFFAISLVTGMLRMCEVGAAFWGGMFWNVVVTQISGLLTKGTGTPNNDNTDNSTKT